ncbi:MAG TPA: N-acetyl-gamma-glutamyl-phosphate reductase [Terriglobales bacterium]|nr:N-acetyl-gamma-glutamyl-phosphate reductase [Terriglobales bacterium]
MPAPLQTAVVGATGYAGFELARLLTRHPRLSAPLLLRRESEDSSKAETLADVFPHVYGGPESPLEPFSWSKLKNAGVSVLFLATPHEVSREMAPEAIERGLRVIDLSGAWRLKVAANRKVYSFADEDSTVATALMQRAVYGLPELRRAEIQHADLLANPGCYATSVILALAPLVCGGMIDRNHDVICDSKSGVSGAGKQPTAKTHFVEVADNFSAYSVFGHRHTGEILEQLGFAAGQLIFTPHLLPIPRGILSTIYLRLANETTPQQVEEAFRSFYSGKPWVRVFAQPQLPQIQFSLRTNFCDIGLTLAPDGKRLVLVSCLDNLLKGAAGQAVQNLNLMLGWDEREGLN